MKRLLLVPAVLAATFLPTTVAVAQACDTPTVNTLISAEAAVSRPAINSPSEIPLSNVYSTLSQATKPQFVYAEAGPQFAGVFEALAPPEAPEPPRAVSAYPSEDIPDDDVEDWGGRSVTGVTSISAVATSAGQSFAGPPGSSADSSRSWVSSIVECDTITVIAGWEANDVVIAPGSTIEQMGQQVTLVVGPGGSSSDVETTLVGAEGFGELPSEGRPLDPFTDPIVENDGPRIEVGDPRTSADEDGASASGGGFNFLFLDPEAGQGAGFRVGSINAQIDVLGALEPDVVDDAVTETDTDDLEPVAALPRQPTPSQQPVARSVKGDPPPPSTQAIDAIETVALQTSLADVIIEDTNWMPLVLTGVAALLAAQVVAAVRIGRRWDPTLDWIARHGDRAAARFAAQYLKW